MKRARGENSDDKEREGARWKRHKWRPLKKSDINGPRMWMGWDWVGYHGVNDKETS